MRGEGGQGIEHIGAMIRPGLFKAGGDSEGFCGFFIHGGSLEHDALRRNRRKR
jgi:hypothetical protein